MLKDLTARLRRGEIHVWQKWLDHTLDLVPEFTTLLGPSERVRGANYRFPEDGHRFVAARAFLRRVLALYLDLDPRQIRFSGQDHGKPVLSGARMTSDLCFSTSRSLGRATVAVAWRRQVGVDLERIRADFEFRDIVDQFFSAAERSALLACPSADRPAAFFRAWVRKEAYLKARGEGLRRALCSFEVPIMPDAASSPAPSMVLEHAFPPDHPEGTIDRRSARGAGWRRRSAQAQRASDLETPGRGTPWFVCDVPTDRDFALAVCAPDNDWSAINMDDVDGRLAEPSRP